MALKKGDFIEITYTGKIDDSQKGIFDTTDEGVAKKEGIYSKQTKYGSQIVVLGEGHILPGLDKFLIGKDVGKHTIKVADVDAFGKKSAKALKLVPAKVFSKENIRPYAGLQINIDDQMGIVRSVSGGRIIVDFNHPLASKDLEYELEVKRIVEDKKEQVESIFKMMGFPVEAIEANDKKVTISTKAALPEPLTKPLSEDLKRLTGVDTIEFKAVKEEKKENK